MSPASETAKEIVKPLSPVSFLASASMGTAGLVLVTNAVPLVGFTAEDELTVGVAGAGEEHEAATNAEAREKRDSSISLRNVTSAERRDVSHVLRN